MHGVMGVFTYMLTSFEAWRLTTWQIFCVEVFIKFKVLIDRSTVSKQLNVDSFSTTVDVASKVERDVANSV